MVAEIFINGIIGGDIFSQDVDDIGTTVEDVRRQFRAVQNPSSITVFINSDGGRVSEGFAIHDFIRAQGLPVTTVGSTVFSIATVILLSGDEDKRYMRPNGRFLVHNPMPSFGIQSDAEGYRELAAVLEKEEEELIAFYARKTGMKPGKIRDEMDKDTIISAKEAVKLGFVNALLDPDNKQQDVSKQPIQAKYIPSGKFYQLREQIINKKNMADNKKTLKERWNALFSSAQDLINESQAETPEEETKEEEETSPNPVEALTKRLEALEAQLSAKQEAEKVAIEAKAKVTTENAKLKNTVAEQNTLMTEVMQKIEAQEKEIEALKAMPAATTQAQNTPIPDDGKPANKLGQILINQGYAAHIANLKKSR